jgi:hypothetical protein
MQGKLVVAMPHEVLPRYQAFLGLTAAALLVLLGVDCTLVVLLREGLDPAAALTVTAGAAGIAAQVVLYLFAGGRMSQIGGPPGPDGPLPV